MSHDRAVYPVVTNNGGNVGIYVFPNQPIINNPTSYLQAGSFISVFNADTFDPATGANGAPLTYLPGPLNAVAASIIQYKCTAFSLTFLPTESSLNN
jgi:hypothetical protein